MTSSSPSVPDTGADAGRKDHDSGRLKPSLRIARRIWWRSNVLFAARTALDPYQGRANGVITERFGSTCRTPVANRESLRQARRKSCTFALGARLPMLFTQRIRLSRARLRMM